MKKIKLLYTLPLIGTSLIPLASCNKPTESLGITLHSEKEQKTISDSWIARFVFDLDKPTDIKNITYKITQKEPKTCDAESFLYVNGKELYLDIVLSEPTPGDAYLFDIEFTVFYKTIKFENLKVTYVQEGASLPDKAFIIDETTKELQGLNPSFTITPDFTVFSVPERIVSIKENAFENKFTTSTNSSITKIKLNSNLTKIGSNTFKGCNSITKLDVSQVPVQDECPIVIGTNAFEGWQTSGEIYYANADLYNALDCALFDQGLGIDWFDNEVDRPLLKADYDISSTTLNGLAWSKVEEAPKHLALINQVVIPTNIRNIADNAFYNSVDEKSKLTSNIKTLSLPEGLETIGNKAFSHTSFNKFINDYDENILILPKQLTSIGENAFSYMPMSGISFNDKLATLGDEAFYNCSSVISIDVSELSDIPAGWSRDTNTFQLVTPLSGTIYSKPALASYWKTYFTGTGIDFSKWSINESVVIVKNGELKPYVPAISPLAGEELTKQEILDRYHQAIVYQSILIDDIIYSIRDHVATNFDDLEVTVSQAEYANNALTLNIVYTAKIKNDENTYSGSWIFNAIDIKDVNNLVLTKDEPNKIMKFAFKNFLTNYTTQAIILETTTTPGGEPAVSTEQFYYGGKTIEVSDDGLGKVLNKLGLLTKDGDGNVFINIYSHYMGECTIKP